MASFSRQAASGLALVLAIPLTVLPLGVQRLLGTGLGWLLFLLLKRRREIAAANLVLAFPELDDRERDHLLWKHFRYLGQLVIDILQQPLFSFPWLLHRKLKLSGFEELEALKQTGKAALGLTSHFGSWEACGVIGIHPGIRLLAVYKPLKGFGDDFVLALRASWNCEMVPKREAKERLTKGIPEGEWPGLVADQGGRTKYSFLGHPAFFPHGPAHYWFHFGLPAFVLLCVLEEDGTTTCHARLLKLPARESVSEDNFRKVFIEAYIQELEEWVRRYPEQYFWLHDIWRQFKVHDAFKVTD